MRYGVGDIVSLTPEALTMPKLAPAQLIRLAELPNRFTVVKTEIVIDSETEQPIHAVKLAECCGHLTNPETGEAFCDSHPEGLFNLVKRMEDPLVSVQNLKPDRETVVMTPFGRAFQLMHFKREGESNVLMMEVPFIGLMAVTGPWADIGAAAAKQYGLL